MLFDRDDPRARSALVGGLMLCGGIGCLTYLFAGHADSVRLLGKLAGLLIVMGVARLWRAWKNAPATAAGPASDVAASAVPASKRQPSRLVRNLLGRSLPAVAGDRDRFWMKVGRVGLVVIVLSVLGAFVSGAMNAFRHTVVLIGVPDPASGPVMILVLVISLFFGTSWAIIGGAKGWRLVLRAAAMWLLFAPTLMMSLVITGSQLAEAAVFAGHTTTAIRTLRVQGASQSHGRGGTKYYAMINPYHCDECRRPEVPVDRTAYDTITAHMIDVPANPDFPWDRGNKTTSLCMTFAVERAVLAERLRLANGRPFTQGDMKPCPAGVG